MARRALVAFLGSGLMARTIGSLIKVDYQGKSISFQQWTYKVAFEPYFADKFASLLWALCFVAFWYGVSRPPRHRTVKWVVR